MSIKHKRVSQHYRQPFQVEESQDLLTYKILSQKSRPTTKSKPVQLTESKTKETPSVFSVTDESSMPVSQIPKSLGGTFSPQTAIFINENNVFSLGQRHQKMNLTSKFRTRQNFMASPTAQGQRMRYYDQTKNNILVGDDDHIITQLTPVINQNKSREYPSFCDESYTNGNDQSNTLNQTDTFLMSFNSNNPLTNDKLIKTKIKVDKRPSYHISTQVTTPNKFQLKPIKTKKKAEISDKFQINDKLIQQHRIIPQFLSPQSKANPLMMTFQNPVIKSPKDFHNASFSTTGGDTNLITFKKITGNKNLTERQQFLLDMQQQRNIQIEQEKAMSLSIKKNYNKKLQVKEKKQKLRLQEIDAKMPVTSRQQGHQRMSSFNANMLLNPTQIDVDDQVRTQRVRMFEANLNLKSEPSNVKISPKKTKTKKDQTVIKDQDESIPMIDPEVLQNRQKVINTLRTSKNKIERSNIEPYINSFMETQDRQQAIKTQESLESLKREESVQSSIKDIQSRISETFSQFFDGEKGKRLSKAEFDKQAFQRRISRQLTAKISDSFSSSAEKLNEQAASVQKKEKKGLQEQTTKDKVQKNKLKFSRAHLNHLTKGSYLNKDLNFQSQSRDQPIINLNKKTSQNSKIGQITIPSSANITTQKVQANPFNFELNVPNLEALNTFRNTISSNLNDSLQDNQASISANLQKEVDIGVMQARDKIFQCEKIPNFMNSQKMSIFQANNNSINFQDQVHNQNINIDELDQSDVLDQTDLICKLQKLGKNQFSNDESIDFDRSIELECLDDERKCKNFLRIQRTSKRNNNLLINSPSIRIESQRYATNTTESAVRYGNMSVFPGSYKFQQQLDSTESAVSSKPKPLILNSSYAQNINEGSQDAITSISYKYIMDLQNSEPFLQSDVSSPLTKMENQFLIIANELLGDEIQKQQTGDRDQSSVDGSVLDKIAKTKEEVKETKHNLQKLLQSQEDIYMDIYGEQEPNMTGAVQPGPPVSVELLSNTEFFFKIEIQEMSMSPVVLRVFQKADEVQNDSIHFSGSFSHKLPNSDHHEIYLKNPSKITISCPSEGKKFEQRCTYYIGIVSISPRIQNITLKCFMRGPAKKQQKPKKKPVQIQQPNNKPQTSSKTSSSRVTPFQRSPQSSKLKFQIGDTREAQSLSEMRETIENAMLNKKTMFEVLEQTKKLRKKQAIQNLLRSQISSQSRKIEVSGAAGEIDQFQFELYDDIDLKDKLNRNIQNVQKGHEEEKEQERQIMAQIKEMRKINATFCKSQKEMEDRIRKIDDVNRWESFRMNKQHFVSIYLEQKKKQAIIKGFLDAFFMSYMVKRTWTCFTETVIAIRAKARMVFMLKRQMKGYKFRQRKLGKDIDTRMLQTIRNSLTFQVMVKSLTQTKSLRKVLKHFFKDYFYKESILQCFLNTMDRIIFIQRRIKSQIYVHEHKVLALKKMWDNECRIIEQSSKKQEGKFKKMLDRYKKVPNDIKEACFRRYLSACKHKHALLFFAWRDKFAQQRHCGLAQAVLQGRIEWMQQNRQEKNKLMNAEEHEIISEASDEYDSVLTETDFNDEINNIEVNSMTPDTSLNQFSSPRKKDSTNSLANKRNQFTGKKKNSTNKSVNKSILEEKLQGFLKSNFKNVSTQPPLIKQRTIISKYTVDPKISKATVARIKSVKKVLEQVASGQDPEIILEHLQDDHHCDHHVHFYRVNTFQEINLNDPFPNKITQKPLTTAQTLRMESKQNKLNKQQKSNDKEKEFEEFDEEIPIQYDVSRLSDINPPQMIWVPSQTVMRKLMNLCASVQDFTDLFYFL